ncbi:MAG: DUF2029 domain-containing protein [Planctomycetes bacterium]|nr:DUF2029 domain-containing protein [Planctomycetota bacterium]
MSFACFCGALGRLVKNRRLRYGWMLQDRAPKSCGVREDGLYTGKLRDWLSSLSPWERAALVIWGAVLLAVCVRAFIAPQTRTVYPIYRASADLWWAGGELYEPARPAWAADGYRYSPTSAILFSPFALCSDALGGVLWRLFNVLCFAIGVEWSARSALPMPLSGGQRGLLWLLMLPMTLQSVGNGQVNLLVAGAMLGAVAAVKEERWILASSLLSIAIVFKLYPLALAMVLIVLYRRALAWRLVVALAMAFGLPFVCQAPSYAVDQYVKWITALAAEDRSAITLDHMYRDVWLLIHLYDVPISRPVYGAMCVAGGGVVAWLCWRGQRDGWPTGKLLTHALALSTTWMMLFGPATESSSFALFAPSFAWSMLEAAASTERSARHGLLWSSAAIFFVAVVIGGVVPSWRLHSAGVHVWASLCYCAYLMAESWRSDAVRHAATQNAAA